MEEHALGHFERDDCRDRCSSRSSTDATVAGKSAAMSWCAETFTEMSSPYGSSLRGPVLPVEAGAFQHPASDLGDEAGPFGERHRGLRRDDAVHRVRPAEERFDAGDPAVGGRRRSVGTRCAARRVPSAPRRSRFSVARWLASRCSRRSTVACRAPPLRFAWYIAVSATCSTSSEPWLPRPANAMPTLALTCTSTSDRKNVCASAAPIRAASGPPCDVSSRSSHRMTNSSPPRRANVSPARRMAGQADRRRR